MKLYKPVFTNKWEIHEKDSKRLKPIGTDREDVTDWTPQAGHFGNIYRNEFFITEAAARQWISKEPVDESDIFRF